MHDWLIDVTVSQDRAEPRPVLYVFLDLAARLVRLEPLLRDDDCCQRCRCLHRDHLYIRPCSGGSAGRSCHASLGLLWAEYLL